MISCSPRPSCELCSSHASLFCPSDSAFLCCSCDSLVHHANFLVARHFRHLLCSICHHFSGRGLSGLNAHSPTTTTCPSCPPPASSQDYLLRQDSLSSSLSSSTDEYKNHNHNKNDCKGGPRRVEHYSNFKTTAAECICVDWCSKLGVTVDLGAVRTACRAHSLLAAMPFRVCLAASMWADLRGNAKYCGGRFRKVALKRLEEVSGVPANIILAAEWKLERALRQDRRRRLQLLAEGWAEC